MNVISIKGANMTRAESARRNTKARERKSKQLVISAITGMYQDEFKKPTGKWNIKALAEFTHLHRDTVSKHLRIYESNKGGLFEEELGTIEGIPEKAPIRKAEYTYEELKEVHDNPHQPTEEEIKNTFIEDDEKVDISKLKI